MNEKMKLEIDLENSTLSEYLNEDDYGNVTFTDAFKEMIVREVFTEAKFDTDIRDYIKSEIKDGLWKQIVSYKQEAAIKGVVDDVIREELSTRRSGSLIFTDAYVAEVKEAVRKYLSSYKKELEEAVRCLVECETRDCLNTLYQGSKLREFVDFEKMSNYVVKTMVRKGMKVGE